MTTPRIPRAQAEAFLGALTILSQRHGLAVDAATGPSLLVPIQPERWTLHAYVLGENGQTFSPSYAPVTMPARLRQPVAKDAAAREAPVAGPARWLIVVRRDHYARQWTLREAFAPEDRVDVLLDRRLGERRAAFSAVDPDRRRGERRGLPAESEVGLWERVGLQIVAPA